MTTPNLNVGTFPMIFAYAAYNENPQSILNQYSETTGWEVVWAGDFSKDNYAYVAINGPKNDANSYIVAIRGSLLSFEFRDQSYQNWVDEDLNVLTQEPWNWFVPSAQSANYTACITAGASVGLSNLQALTDVNTGVTLADYLVANAVNTFSPITITGHSLGGNLASVFVPWLQWYINNNVNSYYYGKDVVYTSMQVFTFAAPAAGNFDFVAYYNDILFPEGYSFRFYNTNDVVPTLPANIGVTADMFNGGPDPKSIYVTVDGVVLSLHDFWEGVRVDVDAHVLASGYKTYMQTNPFAGNMPFTLPINQSYLANTIEDWLLQAAAQHYSGNYLAYFLALPKPATGAQAN
jgi:triacylglycerol lipase